MKPILFAAFASLALLAPTPAEAARCIQGQVLRASLGVCVSKASAIRQGVYKPRKIHRVRFTKRVAPRPIRTIRGISITPSRQLKIELMAWAERNRAWIMEAGL